jgi:type I restriction enzyme, S subunit
MKKYEKYKDSGLKRIGKIPEYWFVKKLKYFAKISNGKDQKSVLIEEGGYPILGTGGVFGRASEYLYDKPSVLLGRKGTIDKPMFITEPFWTVDTLFYTQIKETVNPKFFFYACTTIPFAFYQESSAVPSMTQENLNDILFCSPSIEEQTAIASYLDHKTTQIDALIEKKKQLIEKLKLQRQSVISETVSKGLNPDVLMKDSGIEWLGEIPKHWDTCKIKHLVNLKSGDFISAEKISEFGEFKVLGGNGLRGYTEKYNLEGSYVLIGRQGALCGNINYGKNRFWATEHAVVCYPLREIDTYFLGELLRNMNLNQYSESAAQPGISVGKISNLIIPKAPFKEQIEIGCFLKKKNTHFEESISKIIESIEKLKLYRQSIISEAVTGKIDLRDWGKSESSTN